ncbi:MAG: twin-arginine translocation signal domain-containing protein [Rhodobacteraceae bacterium]|nr:twin-arginine translocation signal domain-containing protein [Paracoccaceae bacterium]
MKLSTSRRDFLKGLLAAAAATQMFGLDVARAAEAIAPVVETHGDWVYLSTSFEQDGAQYAFSMYVKGDYENLNIDLTDRHNPVLRSKKGAHTELCVWGMQLECTSPSSSRYIRTHRSDTLFEPARCNLLSNSGPTAPKVLLENVTIIAGDPFAIDKLEEPPS